MADTDFHLACWRHARDASWWAEVTPNRWREYLIEQGWTRHPQQSEIWARDIEHWWCSESKRSTGVPPIIPRQEHGRWMFEAALAFLNEQPHDGISRLGDLLFNLLSSLHPQERPA